MKAHTYYTIFERLPIGGKLPPFPLAAPLVTESAGWWDGLPASLCEGCGQLGAWHSRVGCKRGSVENGAVGFILYIQPCFQHFGNTHTQPFNGHFSGTTRVSRYQKGKTNLDFTEVAVASAGPYESLHLASDR